MDNAPRVRKGQRIYIWRCDDCGRWEGESPQAGCCPSCGRGYEPQRFAVVVEGRA